MRSLRTRLFVYVVGGAALLFFAAGAALTWRITTWLRHEFDRGLTTKARALIALTEREGNWIEFDFESEHMPEFAGADNPEYFELWLADGTLYERSPSFDADDGTRRAALLRTAEPATAPRFDDLRLPDGRWGRQVRIDFIPRRDGEESGAGAPRAGPGATMIVARERATLDADLFWLMASAAAVAGLMVLALAGVTQMALGVGLRSLDRLGRQVRALDAASLGTRVDVPDPPAEIGMVVRQINALLSRLDAAFRRERRLSSDIAHELRTPIAELRNLCEVGARWPDDRAAVRAFFGDAHAIALSMERIVVQLIALARYDEGREAILTAPVRVADVVEAAWKPLAPAAEQRSLELRQEIAPDLWFDTDPDKFPLIVANILSNAVAYGAPGSRIVCTSEETAGRASVSFENRAENLEPSDLAVMFDRFWRKEDARTGEGHAGLGLSLVRAMADLLRIEITTHLAPDRTFRITLLAPVKT
jgi:signal transduction histidine kinase